MELAHNSRSDFIKITIDSLKNIPISETSKLAKRIKNDENMLSIFPDGYRLEVSTPGIGTNLIKKFQYEKNIGRKISLRFYKGESNIVSGTFVIVDVEDKGVKVSRNEKNYLIMFENVISAKIKVSFD